MSCARPRRGMTLVELSVASVLLAVVAVTMATGLAQLHAQRRLLWEHHVARETVELEPPGPDPPFQFTHR